MESCRQGSRKTIPLTRSNVGFTSTNIGYKGFFTFLSFFQAAEAVAVSDDEEETSLPAASNVDAICRTLVSYGLSLIALGIA